MDVRVDLELAAVGARDDVRELLRLASGAILQQENEILRLRSVIEELRADGAVARARELGK